MTKHPLKKTSAIVLLTFLLACAQAAPLTITTQKTKVDSIIREKLYENTKYRAVIDTLTKIYKKQQYLYNIKNTNSNFFFQITPITLYPFFCERTQPDKKCEVIYIYGLSYSAFRMVDDMRREHVLVGVESYTQDVGLPKTRTYKLHSFSINYTSARWDEDTAAKEIVLELTNAKEGMNGCRTEK